MTHSLASIKQTLVTEIIKRVEDKIIEQTNADLLVKLINNAENINEAISIAMLGTTYKQTGFHFDKQLAKVEAKNEIYYFKKNESLSFKTNNDAITHKLIIGDNFNALTNLLVTYKKRIDTIYIDPPYSKDSMGTFAITNYDNAITRDNLLSMLYPRLILAKQLLSDNGVIFCSIDDRNQAYVKCLFDEIFKESNTDIMVWRKSGAGRDGKMKNTQTFRKDHEYIIVGYKEERKLNKSFEKPQWENEYGNPDNDPRGGYKAGSISNKEEASNPDSENYYTVTSPGGKTFTRQFNVSQEAFDRLNSDNRIYWGRNGDAVPAVKIFVEEERSVSTSSLIDYSEMTTTLGAKTLDDILSGDTLGNEMRPKPVDLIVKLLQIGSATDSIVLDFFAGSGTTGQAVLKLNQKDKGNRQFILATLDEKTPFTPGGIVNEITGKRLKRTMTGTCYDGTNNFKWLENNKPLGGNLDVYDISTVANFEATEGQSPFDVIDETLYGQPKLDTNKKIKWVCENFEGTQKYVAGGTK
ncbi:MAG: site-specific DNA-methyltransferase [Defluviitaleaceae bacterium]|nr:site-specific DNA-methyltransferase [Defluviitaleaceae bacterium]MCL2275461.1 site-specific DNA-methyltransferase [Defluviitaleaceae bacterium]